MLPHHQTTLLTPQILHIARPLFLIVVESATCPTCLSNWESLRKWLCQQQRQRLYSIMNSHIMFSRSSNSVAVYSLHGGHFTSTIQSWNLTFQVWLVCNPHESGRSLFQEFTSCCHIFSSATDLLNHICVSGDTSVIHGYLIHSSQFQTSKTTTTFW